MYSEKIRLMGVRIYDWLSFMVHKFTIITLYKQIMQTYKTEFCHLNHLLQIQSLLEKQTKNRMVTMKVSVLKENHMSGDISCIAKPKIMQNLFIPLKSIGNEMSYLPPSSKSRSSIQILPKERPVTNKPIKTNQNQVKVGQ